jgi:hypothetical protein
MHEYAELEREQVESTHVVNDGAAFESVAP